MEGCDGGNSFTISRFSVVSNFSHSDRFATCECLKIGFCFVWKISSYRFYGRVFHFFILICPQDSSSGGCAHDFSLTIFPLRKSSSSFVIIIERFPRGIFVCSFPVFIHELVNIHVRSLYAQLERTFCKD